MSLKQFRFEVTNTRTGEKAAFIGDGEKMAEAFAEGVKNCQSAFRPKDGKGGNEQGMAVTTKQGGVVKRTLREFESDYGYMMPAPQTDEAAPDEL